MDNLLERMLSLGQCRRGGVLLLTLGLLATLVWVRTQGHVTGNSGNPTNGVRNHLVSVHPETGVELTAKLSHPMVVQGSEGTIYLDLSIRSPKNTGLPQGASDIIVVLDRSGSMGEDNKWRSATEAVYSLLDLLTPSDRIALITFDTRALVNSELVSLDDRNAGHIRSTIRSLSPGASTNLGEALLLAENMASASPTTERRCRIILLSDGHANTGIAHPAELGLIAKRIADRGNIVSTIGMGLGFNETLMASLADHGMGSFNYLEHLESLGTILAQELSDSRRVFAEGSKLKIHLPEGIELLDVSGLPFEQEGRTAIVRAGQIFENSTKRLTATLQVANQTLAEYDLDTIDLSYTVQGKSYEQHIQSDQLNVACVPQDRNEEALAAVDKEVFRDVWIRNNLGAFMRRVGDLVREGKKSDAKALMQSYETRLQEADAVVPGLKREAGKELHELESRIDEAFCGLDQSTKQNRTAKSLLEAGQELQREVYRNPK